MNIKIASRLVYILLLISMGLVVTLRTTHLPKAAVCTVAIAIGCVYMTLRLIAIRQKALANEGTQVSGILKIWNTIIIAAGYGAMLALVLKIWHVQYIGQLLLNFSLIVFILGFIGIMVSPQKTDNAILSPTGTRVFRVILCLCIISTVIGMLLSLNHYPGGRSLMCWSLAALFIALVPMGIYAKYIKKKRSI